MMTKTGIPKFLTGFHIKLIAIISMLLDHFADIFMARVLGGIYAPDGNTEAVHTSARWLWDWISANERVLWSCYDVLRWAGRPAFPLFCFLLVEGFIHTKNRKKYGLRLLLFALISEIPYDLAFSNRVLELKNNNVFFTLLLGFLMLWAVSFLQDRIEKYREKGAAQWLCVIMHILAPTACLLVSFVIINTVLCSSYVVSGVFAIMVLYLLRKRPALAMAVTVIILSILNISFVMLFALPAVAVVLMYNKERGRPVKYGFYVFYPAHILILYALGRLVLML